MKPVILNHTPRVTELPEIRPGIRHFVLRIGKCTDCGAIHKAEPPPEHQTGFGPRLSALIAEMARTDGDSRTTVRNLCESVPGSHISPGATRKVADRVSRAMSPHCEETAAQVRENEISHADETTWRTAGKPHRLRVMADTAAAFFMIHPSRSGEAFEELTGELSGILTVVPHAETGGQNGRPARTI